MKNTNGGVWSNMKCRHELVFKFKEPNVTKSEFNNETSLLRERIRRIEELISTNINCRTELTKEESDKRPKSGNIPVPEEIKIPDLEYYDCNPGGNIEHLVMLVGIILLIVILFGR